MFPVVVGTYSGPGALRVMGSVGRPSGKTDYQRRLKAFEMYAAGVKKVEIARELGVTRPAVGAWSVNDKWDERMTNIVNRAEEALNHGEGNEVANTLKVLRDQLSKRIGELEDMCRPSSPPAVRMQAIKMWFTLAGVTRGIPNPTAPTTPKSLELIQDLLNDQAETETPSAGGQADYQPLYVKEATDNEGRKSDEAAQGDDSDSPGNEGVVDTSDESGLDTENDPDGNVLAWGDTWSDAESDEVGETGGQG
jgi:predicted transcriptional regulator